MKYILEYIWLGGNYELRSKIRVYETSNTILCMNDLKNVPAWNYDGSSTSQTSGENSEINLLPVSVYKNPLFKYRNQGLESLLVLCETRDKDGNPLETNNRNKAMKIFDKYTEHCPWFGLEQEYFILNEQIEKTLKNLTEEAENPDECGIKQGQYYCSVGGKNAFFRNIVDKHMIACIDAGLNISGINAEVAPYQWEFQVGPCSGIDSGDQMWIARYLLEKIAEEEGCFINWKPKPFKHINGSGCHTNFSTKTMRESDDGLSTIMKAIEKLEKNHQKHMLVYGKDNDKRMSGKYETSSYDKFSVDFNRPVNRGASIRVGHDTIKEGRGYFEDRRPGSNIDPYLVTSLITDTCLN